MRTPDPPSALPSCRRYPLATAQAAELALPCPWPEVPALRVVPSARNLATNERDPHVDPQRLARSLTGLAADVVVLDLPNRQGRPLVQNGGLTCATTVVYPAKLDEDGLDGAALSVRVWREDLARRGTPIRSGSTRPGSRQLCSRWRSAGRRPLHFRAGSAAFSSIRSSSRLHKRPYRPRRSPRRAFPWFTPHQVSRVLMAVGRVGRRHLPAQTRRPRQRGRTSRHV